MLVLILVLVFIFLTVPGRDRRSHVLRFGIVVLDSVGRNRPGVVDIRKGRCRNQGVDAVPKAVTDLIGVFIFSGFIFLFGFVLCLYLSHGSDGRRYGFRIFDLCSRSRDGSHKTAEKQNGNDRLLH